MKKIILVSLCVLCLAGTSAFGYSVSGLVKDESGNTVSGASVYINCYPAAGGSLSDTDTSGPLGGYSGGWPLTNCKGEKIVVKAVSGNKSGTMSWIAQHEAEVQNVTISNTIFPTAELHCEAQPMPMSEPYQVVPSTVQLYMQVGSGPILVHGGSTTMQYDTQTMYCSSVQSNPPFTTFSYYEPVPGTINVNAYAPPGMYVPVQNGEHPTPFFTLNLVARDFNTPGKISNVKLTRSEITTNTGSTISAFPSRTEYVIGEPNAHCNPYRRIATQQDWEEALSSGHVYAMEQQDWEGYMYQWQNFTVEGEPYPNDTFLRARPPEGALYVYGGGGGGGGGGADPCDAGLVMGWGYPGMPAGSYCSAWKFDYLKDPDLRNCIITVVVTAPQFGASGQINQVSFGLQNAPIPGGPIRAWYWNCGAAGSGAPITWGVPTQIKIDTTQVGVAAATPVATAYANNPAFNLQNVQWLIVDENGNWIGGPNPVPAPGGFQFLWNYWHWLMISPKTTLSKDYYKKWSQPPVVLDTNNPPVFLGWDERSDYSMMKIVADDWQCKDDRPITDIHWWGSFIGWNEPYPPPVVPIAFHIGIWTDVPNPDPCDPLTFSHPGKLIWENYCDNFVWNFAGYDSDPRMFHDPCVPMEPNEACFQYNQLLSQDEWFHQDPTSDPNGRVYWLSISAIWGGGTIPPYQWGWKTRPHYWNNDAVQIQQLNPIAPPTLGSQWVSGVPITFPPYPNPDSVSFDMAFELTTNEPAYADNPIPGDLNADKIVNFYDLAILADNWLATAP